MNRIRESISGVRRSAVAVMVSTSLIAVSLSAASSSAPAAVPATALASSQGTSAAAEILGSNRVSAASVQGMMHFSAAVAPMAAASPSGLLSVSSWETLFQGRAAADDSRVYSKLSTSSDSWDYYNLAFGLDAYTSMYRATGKTMYLDKSLSYVNSVIARAKASSLLGSAAYGDSYLGWVSQRSDVRGQETPLFESFLWRYVTEMLWVMRQTPAVYGNAGYKSQYDRILAFTEKNIFDKWYTRGDGHGGGGAGFPNMYRQNTNMAAHWAFISLLLSRLTTDPTRRSRAVTVYTNIDMHVPVYGSSLRRQFLGSTSAPGSYEWNSVWDSAVQGITASNVQDVPHGSNEVAYIVTAFELGTGVWTAGDITALSHTLTDVVWRKDGTYAANVDGTGQGNGVIFDGFMKLGRYNAAIQKRLESYSGAISDNNYAVIAFYANGALNAKYLGV